MEVIITAEQRDVLYEYSLSRLLAADDLGLLIKEEDFKAASRLGRELAAELRLVMPADELGWLFSQLQRQARIQKTVEAEERAEATSLWQQTQAINEVCDQVLAAIEQPSPGDRHLAEPTPQRSC